MPNVVQLLVVALCLVHLVPLLTLPHAIPHAKLLPLLAMLAIIIQSTEIVSSMKA